MVSESDRLPPDSALRADASAGSWGIASVIASIFAATAIGFAIHQHGGEYTTLAIKLVAAAIIAAVVAVWMSRRDVSAPLVRWIEVALLTALAMQFIALFVLWPIGPDQAAEKLDRLSHIQYFYLLGASAFLIFVGCLNIPSMRHGWFPALLLIHALLGIWTIRSCPWPHIDVWYFQEIGPLALVDGRNPYDAAQVKFPDIYLSTRNDHQRVYGEGMVKNDLLQFGFPYPPISLFCSTAGFLLGNDTRYAQAIALTMAGLFIGYSRPGRISKFAAALLMFTPTVCFVLGRAWTEPFVILFLAATIFCGSRKLRWLLPVALGLFLASKQYVLFAVPLSLLLIEDFNWRSTSSWRKWMVLLFGAMAVAIVISLPLAARDFHAFWYSTVTVQKEAPFRWDALSFLVWAGFNLDSKYTRWTWLAFAGVVPACLFCFWKIRRGPGGFALSLALVYLVFIAFNKQAFCNYYFFVIGCFCCAMGATTTISPSGRIMGVPPMPGAR